MGHKIGKDCKISKKAIINVEELEIGDRTIILDHAKIEGRKVILGKECFIHEYSWIGGGSCFENTAELIAGDFLHMGRFSHVNTAYGVYIGHEVGIGHMTNIWTHGAYPPIDYGFPVQFASVHIESRVWLPHAWVNPGVTIGVNTVVAAMSLVNKSLPARCLAGGIPAKVIKEYAFPSEHDFHPMHLNHYLNENFGSKYTYDYGPGVISHGRTNFDIRAREIRGPVTKGSERLKDLLRRCGIRFRYFIKEGKYIPWESE